MATVLTILVFLAILFLVVDVGLYIYKRVMDKKSGGGEDDDS